MNKRDETARIKYLLNLGGSADHPDGKLIEKVGLHVGGMLLHSQTPIFFQELGAGEWSRQRLQLYHTRASWVRIRFAYQSSVVYFSAPRGIGRVIPANEQAVELLGASLRKLWTNVAPLWPGQISSSRDWRSTK